jgi:hypothetical protein
VFALLAAIAVFQAYYLAVQGQTLGKKWLGIRIVDVQTHKLGGIAHVVLVRTIINFILEFIPFYGIADALFIFGSDQSSGGIPVCDTLNDVEDLAPTIYRQRLIVEGTRNKPITSQHIKRYLSELSRILDMHALTKPVTHRSRKFGWAGWIHWETSGCHFYAWDEPYPFFSADIYTCKKFDDQDAVTFTQDFFEAEQVTFQRV